LSKDELLNSLKKYINENDVKKKGGVTRFIKNNFNNIENLTNYYSFIEMIEILKKWGADLNYKYSNEAFNKN